MKRLFGIICFVFTVILCIGFFEGSDVLAAYKTGKYVINTQSSDLNVRSCPSAENMKVGSVPKGKTVTVTCVSSNGWGKIVYGSVHGWISLEYCKYVGEADTVETSSIKKSAPLNDSVSYGLSSSSISWVIGCNQEFSKSSGLCTSSATGTLLRRRQAAEGKEVTFTFSDVRTSLGGSGTPDSKGKYASVQFYYTPQNGWIHTDSETGETTVYYTVQETLSTHAKNREYIADLMDSHPEGVVIYTKYGSSGKHAILLSDYVRNKDGSISFYAYDPANHGIRTRLEDTWLMTKFKSVGGLFNGITMIWYIKGELCVDDNAFEHPEAQAYVRTVYTAKKNSVLYSAASTGSDEIVSLKKGTPVDIMYKVTNKNDVPWFITAEGYYIPASKVTAEAPKNIAESVAEQLAAFTGEESTETDADSGEDESEADSYDGSEADSTVFETDSEAASEANTEAASEANTEAASETSTEAASETSTETASETSTETASEANTEAVSEANSGTAA